MDLLTNRERQVITEAGRVWNMLCEIVEDGPTRDADLAEVRAHVHAIQRFVGAQAAARAYPGEYRLAGGNIA